MTIDQIYEKYRHLTIPHLSKIRFTDRALDVSDLKQELEIKLFESIGTYLRKWKKFRNGESKKPIRIDLYLKLCLRNYTNDFTKKLVIHQNRFPNSLFSFDPGLQTESDIRVKDKVYHLKGIDLLSGLSGLEKQAFIMYLNGHSISDIHSKFKSHFERNYLFSFIKDRISTIKTKISNTTSINFVNSTFISDDEF